MGTVLRVATPGDIEAIFEIRTAVVQNHLSREQMAELGITPQVVADSMREAPCVWLAEVNGTPVAFSMVDFPKARCSRCLCCRPTRASGWAAN